MLEWFRRLLNLKQIEDDLAMLKEQVDQLQEIIDNIAPEEGDDDDT
jgi:hypothetical protein